MLRAHDPPVRPERNALNLCVSLCKVEMFYLCSAAACSGVRLDTGHLGSSLNRGLMVAAFARMDCLLLPCAAAEMAIDVSSVPLGMRLGLGLFFLTLLPLTFFGLLLC
jgi:hypothetical protein